MTTVYIYSKDYSLKNLKLPKDKNFFLIDNFYKEGLEFKEDDIFITYENKNPLECRLEHYVIPAESLVIATDSLDIVKLLDKKNMEAHYTDDYSIFSGSKVYTIKENIKLEINKTISFLGEVMYQMLDAGYLEKKNYKKVEDWIISFEHPILKIFKIYHKIVTSNPSIDFEEEFLINPQFREMVLETIMKVLANYIINNEVTTLEKVARFKTWKDAELWLLLKKKITNL